MQERKTTLRSVAVLFTLSLLLSACGGGADSGTSNSPAAPSLGGGGGVLASGTYMMAWDAVSDPRVTGYKIYYSSAPFTSMVQPQTITVGNTTSYQLAPGALGISAGTTVYLAVAATGASGMESPLTDTVSITTN